MAALERLDEPVTSELVARQIARLGHTVAANDHEVAWLQLHGVEVVGRDAEQTQAPDLRPRATLVLSARTTSGGSCPALRVAQAPSTVIAP